MRKLFLTVTLVAAAYANHGFADEPAQNTDPAIRADEVTVDISPEQLSDGMATMFYDSIEAVARVSFYSREDSGPSVLTGSFKVNVRLSQAGALLFLEEKTDDWIMHLYNVKGRRLSDLLGDYYGVRLGGGLFFNAQMQALTNRNLVMGFSGHQPQRGDFLVGPSTGVMWVSISKCKDNVNWNTTIQ